MSFNLDVDLTALDCLKLGCTLMGEEEPLKALAFFHAALDRDPKCDDAYVNIAGAMVNLRRHEEAIAPARAAVAINPNNHGGWLNLGSALQISLQLDEGLECIDKAIALNPPYAADCWMARSMSFQYRGDVHEAMCCYAQALALEPNNDLARMSLGLMEMLDGQWEPGLRNYEARISRVEPYPTDEIPKYVHAPGNTLAGKRVLICGEQGAGDAIHFARYFRVLRAMHPTTEFTYVCANPIHPWMDQYDLRVICPAMGSGGNWNMQIPLMSVLLYLHDRKVPFIIPPERPPGFPAYRGGPGIGFCWRGNADHAHDKFRSMAFDTMMQIIDAVPSPHYPVCLQVDATAEQKEEFLFAPQLSTWHDTALAMLDLDAVVTVDTAVAHLAGTLGVPTILLLPLITDWRWGMYTPTTPLYPTMRIFRQTKLGDWSPVIKEVQEALHELHQKNSSPNGGTFASHPDRPR